MRRLRVALILSAVCCLISACVVRSVYPWFPDITKVTDISLIGVWHDEKKDVTTFFTSGRESNYNVLVISDKKEQTKFTASLHRLNKTLFLVVGPEDRNDMGVVATLPGYLLFRVEFQNDSMKLFGFDLESFGDRIKGKEIKILYDGGENKGYVLFSPTEHLTAFVRSQLDDKPFFDEKPMYSFKKVTRK